MSTAQQVPVLSSKTFEISDLSWGQLGSRPVTPLLSKGDKFLLQTPKMVCPFGLSSFDKKGTSPQKYTLSLNLNESPSCTVFQQKITQLDDWMIQSETQKGVSPSVAESRYKPMLKHSINKKTGLINSQYPPFISPNVHMTGKKACAFFDEKGQPMTIKNDNPFPQRSQCIALLKGQYWSSSFGFGITWTVEQLQVFPPAPASAPPSAPAVLLITDPDDDDDGEDD